MNRCFCCMFLRERREQSSSTNLREGIFWKSESKILEGGIGFIRQMNCLKEKNFANVRVINKLRLLQKVETPAAEKCVRDPALIFFRTLSRQED